MSSIIDYSKYNITSTPQFDNGITKLREDGHLKELDKLFRIIDEIIEDVDMYDKEYARYIGNSDKIVHIHLDGRKTGDIILLYRVDGRNIDLDLRLHNITNHKQLSRVSSKKYTARQTLHEFDVIPHKYTQSQIEYAECAYLDLISDYSLYKRTGDKRKQFSNKFLESYFNNNTNNENLTYDEFLELILYCESNHQKHIFGSTIQYDDNVQTAPITSRESDYILDIFDELDIYIDDVYIETETDEYGDTYESMFIICVPSDYYSLKLLESSLYQLESQLDIMVDISRNGLGSLGRTYELYHHFM